MNKRTIGLLLAPTPFCLALLACHPAGTGVIPKHALVAPAREPLIVKEPTTGPAPNTVVVSPETLPPEVLARTIEPLTPPLAPMLTRSPEHPATTEHGVADIRFIGPQSCTIETNGVRALFAPQALPSLAPLAATNKGAHKRHAKAPSPLTAEQVKERLQLQSVDVVAVNHIGQNGLQSVATRALERAYHPTFVVPKGSKAALVRFGVPAARVIEITAMEEVAIGHDAHMTLVPAPESHLMGAGHHGKTFKHKAAAAAAAAKAKAIAMNDAGYVLREGNATFYVAGEGKDGPQFEQVHNRFGTPDVAVLNVTLTDGATGAVSTKLTRAEAEKAQTVLNSVVTIGLPVSAGQTLAPPSMPRTPGSLVPCLVAPVGGETLHVALGHRGPCEATSASRTTVLPSGPAGILAPGEAVQVPAPVVLPAP